MRIHTWILVSQVSVRDVVVSVTEVNAVVFRAEDLDADSNLCGEVQLSLIKQLAVKVKESSSAGEEWLDSSGVQPI